MKKTPVVLFLSVFLLGCSKQAIQPEVISESIEISYEDTGSIAGNPVDVWLTNTSKYCIEFNLQDGMKVFAKQEEQWVEILNLVEYWGDPTITLMPKGDLSSKGSVNIRPEINSLVISTPTDAYALLTGQLCDDDTIKIQKKIPFTITP